MRAYLNDVGARLAALAEFETPSGGWQAVLAARDAREARLDRRWPLALATVVIAVTAGLALWLQSAQHSAVARAVVLPAAAAGPRAESERLEQILARLPERRSMRGSTAFTIAELEDRLSLVDDRLSRATLEPNAPEQSERLWRERVDILYSLVQVRYSDAVGT